MAIDNLFEIALRDHLENLGLTDSQGNTPVWYTGLLQDQQGTPDFVCCVIPEPGLPPVNVIGERPQITIRVRHKFGRMANLFMRKVFLALQEYSSPDLAGTGIGVARIAAAQGPVQIGRDDGPGQGRWIVQQTFQCILASY